MVVVLCNLKPKKLAEFMSHGMVMCAETVDKSIVELLTPPEGSVPGDLISFDNYERKPLEMLPAKKSPYETVGPALVVDDKLQGCFKEESGNLVVFKTDKGVCKSWTITNGVIR